MRKLLLLLMLVCLLFGFQTQHNQPEMFFFKSPKKIKILTRQERTHQRYLDATVVYLNGVVQYYPDCKLNLPPFPKITVVKTGHIIEYCPEFARACYFPFTNHIYYEKGDYEALKHEMAHSILSYNMLNTSCIQELIIQQMDFILRDQFDGKRGRFPKS